MLLLMFGLHQKFSYYFMEEIYVFQIYDQQKPFLLLGNSREVSSVQTWLLDAETVDIAENFVELNSCLVDLKIPVHWYFLYTVD